MFCLFVQIVDTLEVILFGVRRILPCVILCQENELVKNTSR